VSSAVARLTAMRSGGPKTDRGGVRLADFLHANVRGLAGLSGLFRWYRPSEIVPALLARNDYLVPTSDSLDR
jgi:hypothetical protein